MQNDQTRKPHDIAYCLFETPIGVCGIGWTNTAEPSIRLFQLPEATRGMTESRIARAADALAATSPPPAIAAIIYTVCRHLSGDIQDLREIPVELSGVSPLARAVYAAIREIPSGETHTYGEVATTIGQPMAAQAVGQALGRNPIALIIPCHRVLAAGGKPGGFSAPGGTATKERLLEIEGASLNGGQTSFDLFE